VKIVSRATDLKGFIKKDEDEALIEIELQGDGGSAPNPVVKRIFGRDGKHEWVRFFLHFNATLNSCSFLCLKKIACQQHAAQECRYGKVFRDNEHSGEQPVSILAPG